MATDRRSFLKGCLAGAGTCLLGATDLLATTAGDDFGDRVAMLNDCTRCVGCRACQNACHQQYGLPSAGNDPLYDKPMGLEATHLTTIKLYSGGGVYSFVKRQCMHCNYPSCASACPVTALHKNADGNVTYDASKCIGCRYCMVACPFNVPRFEFQSATPEIRKCTFCADRLAEGRGPLCAEVCPTGAILFGTRDQVLKEAYRRLEAEPNRYIPHVYGEHEVGGTSVMYLSGVSFEKLGLRPFEDDPLPQTAENIQHGIFKWFVTPIALLGLLGLARVSNLRCDPVTDADCIEEE